jgi:hypothetical protein
MIYCALDNYSILDRYRTSINDSILASLLGLFASVLPVNNVLAQLLGDETTTYGTLRLYRQALCYDSTNLPCKIGKYSFIGISII